MIARRLFVAAVSLLVGNAFPRRSLAAPAALNCVVDRILTHSYIAAIRIGLNCLCGSGESTRSIVDDLRLFAQDIRLYDDCSAADILEAVQRMIVSDFSEEKTVVVNGWVLSDSEVRLCMLAAVERHNLMNSMSDLRKVRVDVKF